MLVQGLLDFVAEHRQLDASMFGRPGLLGEKLRFCTHLALTVKKTNSCSLELKDELSGSSPYTPLMHTDDTRLCASNSLLEQFLSPFRGDLQPTPHI